MNTANLLVTAQPAKTITQTHKIFGDANAFLQEIFKCKDDFTRPIIKEITPEIAQKLLKRNTKNRALRRRHVVWLAKQMSLGYWLFTGDTIRFSQDGFLCDKQHTLSAIIESETTQRFIVLCGLDNRVIEVLDTGIARTAGDVLKMNGIQNANNVAAICRRVMMFKSNRKTAISANGYNSKGKMNEESELILNMSILDEVSRDQMYHDAVIAASKYYEYFKAIRLSFYGALHYLFSEKNTDDAWEFLSKFSSGVGLEQDSPIYLLRKRMENEALSKIKYDDKLRVFWFITCWNKFRRGEKLKVLQTPGSIVIPEIE